MNLISNLDEETRRLPEDVLEIIFGKLWTGDRVRLRLVCKPWNRVLIQSHIPTAPEAPWEILSDDSYNNPQSYSTQICFKSLSENRIYRFNLPMLCGLDDNRCWLCAYSRGWLVLAVGQNLNPDVILWNPLSGTTRKLPPLSTLPFFDDFEDSARLGIKIENLSNVIIRVEIFSVGSVDCVVAALFSTSRGKRIALCTQREVKWTPFNVEKVKEEGEEVNIEFQDILFHTSGGNLVALVINPFSTDIGIENFHSKKFEISLTDCQVQLVPQLVPCDQANPMQAQRPFGFKINTSSKTIWHLVESSIMHTVICIAAKFETFMSNNNDKGLIPKFSCGQTTELLGWTDKPPVYKKEATFIGATGSFTVPILPGILPDCMYFAIDNILGVVGHGDGIKPYIIRESGKYDLGQNNNRMHRNPSRTIKYPSGSKIGWFMPRLFMS